MAQPGHILILHCPTGGGHRAAAQALSEEAAARGLKADVVDALAFAPPWFGHAYVETHLKSSAYLPGWYGHAYFASNRLMPVADEIRRAFDHIIGEQLVREVLRRRVAAVVTTHFYPLAILSAARKTARLSAPLISVLTDYAAHAVWATPGADLYCCPAGSAASDLLGHGVPTDRLAITGIPVRAGFGSAAHFRAPSAGETLRVLLTSGGFGVGPVRRALSSFAGVSGVRLTVVCGANPRLVERVREIAAALRIPAEVVGFEPNMPARIADAHVVVGKPGGLTVSECLAAGRPIVTVGAVPGQETLNQRFVVGQGAAVAAEPEAVGPVVSWLRASGALLPIADRARSLGKPGAANAVVEATVAVMRAAAGARERAPAAAASPQ